MRNVMSEPFPPDNSAEKQATPSLEPDRGSGSDSDVDSGCFPSPLTSASSDVRLAGPGTRTHQGTLDTELRKAEDWYAQYPILPEKEEVNCDTDHNQAQGRDGATPLVSNEREEHTGNADPGGGDLECLCGSLECDGWECGAEMGARD